MASIAAKVATWLDLAWTKDSALVKIVRPHLQCAQQRTQVLQPLGDDVLHAVDSFPPAFHGQQAGADQFSSLAFGQIVALRDSGCAILLVSAELEEVTSLSDRLLIIHEGRIAGEVDPKFATLEEIGLLMTRGH